MYRTIQLWNNAMDKPTTPSAELYNALQLLYNHFNEKLFDAVLPQVLFTTQRQAGMMGYFSLNRWSSNNGKNCHEIAINPEYVGRASLIELMQTMVHEMVHCWQHSYGKPSRTGYHNKEWAAKMISIGLMPTDTGMPGGMVTGQHMNDYPIAEGKFIVSCIELLKNKNYIFPWVDKFARVSDRPKDEQQIQAALQISNNHQYQDLFTSIDEVIKEQLCTPVAETLGASSSLTTSISNAKMKKKYTCQGCKINVWGKPDLLIKCAKCDLLLLVQ